MNVLGLSYQVQLRRPEVTVSEQYIRNDHVVHEATICRRVIRKDSPIDLVLRWEVPSPAHLLKMG